MNWFIIPFRPFPLEVGFKPYSFPDGIELHEQSGQFLLQAMKASYFPMDSVETLEISTSMFALRAPFPKDAKLFSIARQADVMTLAIALSQEVNFSRKYGFVSSVGENAECSAFLPYPASMVFPTAYDDRKLARTDLAFAAKLYPSISKIYYAKGSRIGAALQLFWSSCHARWTTHRILSQWAGLEALFGSHSEISHKLSQRISFFLEEDGSKRTALFKQVKKSYGVRSDISHGKPFFSFKRRTSAELRADADVLFLDRLIRKVLRNILTSEAIWSMFDGNDRESLLDEAVLTGCRWPANKRFNRSATRVHFRALG